MQLFCNRLNELWNKKVARPVQLFFDILNLFEVKKLQGMLEDRKQRSGDRKKLFADGKRTGYLVKSSTKYWETAETEPCLLLPGTLHLENHIM